MKKHSKRAGVLAAFTLTELMVVIVIIAVLSAIVFSVSKYAKKAGESATCLNRLRQVGTILSSRAVENNNRYQVFAGGSGSFEYRPYIILRDELDLPASPSSAHYETLKNVMFCPSGPGAHSEPKNPHWTCYGVNIADSDLAGSKWITESVKDSSGRSGNLSVLRPSSVRSPSRCVLVADSCTNDGSEIFRIKGGDRIGMRHNGKANAIFLDGSARSLGKNDLGQLGFDKAYDTSGSPPTLVSLPSPE